MNKINLPKINYHVDKKSYLPAIIALIISIVPWYFSSHFSSDLFSKHLTIQILFFLATFMVNFITMDRLTNRTNLRLIMPLAVIPLLIFAVLLLSKERYISFIGLLSFTPFISTFLPYSGKNGVGLISFSVSSAILIPLAYFYIRNNFVSEIFLKICVLLALTFISVLFSIFISDIAKFNLLALGLILLTLIFSFFILKSWSALIYPIVSLIGWIIPRLKLPRNLNLLILIVLTCVLMIFTTSN